MSGFEADWLALRSDADARARDPALLAAAAERVGDGLALDLGAGTGATLWALAPQAPAARWRLVDDDPALLQEAERRAETLGARAETLRLDLARHPEAALEGRPALVTASAFFDLVSEDWMRCFAAAARSAGAAVYAALTYDGVEWWSPPHGEDAAVRRAFAADMIRDKGFGPALGGRAAQALADALAAEGYRVRRAASPWRLTQARDGALIAALAEGQARACGASDDWLAARRASETVEIGHEDLFATP